MLNEIVGITFSKQNILFILNCVLKIIIPIIFKAEYLKYTDQIIGE